MFAAIKTRYIILFFLTVLSCGFIYLTSEKKKSLLFSMHHFPTTYGVNIRVQRFNEQGFLERELVAPRMTHFEPSNQTYFDLPKVTLYSATQQPWHLSANQAVASPNFTIIQLSGNVSLMQAASAKNNAITILTSAMTVNTQQQLAYSNQPIKLIQEGLDHSQTIIDGVGVQVNQKTGTVQLLSKARGYYVPPPMSTTSKP